MSLRQGIEWLCNVITGAQEKYKFLEKDDFMRIV